MSNLRLRLATFIIATLVGTIGRAHGADLTPADIERLLLNAHLAVYRVQTGKSGGSAVLLKVRQSKNKRIAYLATCYHVIHNASAIRLYDRKGDYLGDPETISVATAPDLDLAFIRCDIPNVKLTPALDHRIIKHDDQTKDELLGIGYPFYRRPVLHEARVRLAKSGASGEFEAGIFTSSSQLKVRPVLGEPTAPGMSGGIVVDRNNRFAGLVIGRLRDVATFVIPADFVRKQFKLALAKETEFKPIKDLNLTEWPESPYTAEVKEFLQTAKNVFDDSLTWGLFSNWQDIFEEKSIFRRRFQEISIDLARLAEGQKGLKLKIEPSTFATQPGAVNVYLNGVQKTFDSAGEFSLDDLTEGENLMVINRKCRNQRHENSFSINRMMQPLALNFTLCTKDGTELYSVNRELPAVFNGFDTYVTLQFPLSAKKVSYNAIFAVDLKKAASYLTKNPFLMSGRTIDSKLRAGISMSVKEPKISVRGVSEQTIEFNLKSRIKTSDFGIRYAGMHLQRKPEQTSNLEVEGVLQLVRYRDQYRLVGRLVGGYLDDFNINLSDELSVDIGTPLTEFIVAGANNQLRDSLIDSKRIQPIRSNETQNVSDLLLPRLLSDDETIRVKHAHFQADGWLVLALQMGKSVSPAARKLPVAKGGHFAQFQTLGIPEADMKRVLSRTLSQYSPALQKSAASLASHANVFWKLQIPSRARTPIPIEVGRFKDWFKPLLKQARQDSQLEFKLTAMSLIAAVKPYLNKAKIEGLSGTGEINVVVRPDGVVWTGKNLAYHAEHFVQGSTRFQDVHMQLNQVHVSLDQKGSVSGKAQGKGRIGKLIAKEKFTSISTDFNATLSGAEHPVVQSDMTNLRGKYKGVLAKAQNGKIVVKDGRLNGNIYANWKVISARFHFGESTGVKIDSPLLKDAARSVEKGAEKVIDAAEDAAQEAGNALKKPANEVKKVENIIKKIRVPF